MTTSIPQPNWLDTQLYPFTSRYLSLKKGTMHYLDEGEGACLLFVHGTPTWSFLYRDFIKELSKHHRCIAIDHLGFGLSEKPRNFEGTPENHAANLTEFIEKLDLQNITLIVHDFGGPIGLAAGIAQSHRIKQIVLFNSWMWATKQEKAVQKVDKTINSWLGKLLYLRFNFSPKVLLKQGFHDKKQLSKSVHQHYIQPFPTKSSRQVLLHLAQALMGASDWYEAQWQQLDKLATKKWLILWGKKDSFITTRYLEKWQSRLPQASVEQLDCGHFIQEEKTEEAIRAIKRFLSR